MIGTRDRLVQVIIGIDTHVRSKYLLARHLRRWLRLEQDCGSIASSRYCFSATMNYRATRRGLFDPRVYASDLLGANQRTDFRVGHRRISHPEAIGMLRQAIGHTAHDASMSEHALDRHAYLSRMIESPFGYAWQRRFEIRVARDNDRCHPAVLQCATRAWCKQGAKAPAHGGASNEAELTHTGIANQARRRRAILRNE